MHWPYKRWDKTGSAAREQSKTKARPCCETLEERRHLSAQVIKLPDPQGYTGAFDELPSLAVVGSNAYVADPQESQVLKVDLSGRVKAYEYKYTVDPYDITAATDKSPWFSEGSRIGHMSTSGKVRFITLPSDPNYGLNPATMLEPGNDGSVWFGAYEEVGHISSDGAVSVFPIYGLGSATPEEIFLDSSGNPWVLTSYLHAGVGFNYQPVLAHIGADGTVSNIATLDYEADQQVALGPGRDLYFVASNQTLESVTLAGQISTASFDFSIYGMYTAFDDSLWLVTSSGLAHLTSGLQVHLVNGSQTWNSAPQSVVETPDGNFWFASAAPNTLSRLTLSGNLTQYQLPAAVESAGVDQIAAFGSNNLWVLAGSEGGGGNGTFLTHLSTDQSLLVTAATTPIGSKLATTLATFSADTTHRVASDFSARITWPDRTVTAGAIRTTAPGEFSVIGAEKHAMPDGVATVLITDHADGQTGAASVAVQGNIGGGGGRAVKSKAMVGVRFAGVIADFPNVSFAEIVHSYSTNIQWGTDPNSCISLHVGDGPNLIRDGHGGVELVDAEVFNVAGTFPVTVDLGYTSNGTDAEVSVISTVTVRPRKAKSTVSI